MYHIWHYENANAKSTVALVETKRITVQVEEWYALPPPPFQSPFLCGKHNQSPNF